MKTINLEEIYAKNIAKVDLEYKESEIMELIKEDSVEGDLVRGCIKAMREACEKTVEICDENIDSIYDFTHRKILNTKKQIV